MEINRRAAKQAGHQIIVEINNIKDGPSAIKKAVENGVNVALLDGSIPNSRSDGKILAEALRRNIPGIRIVDVSAFGDAIPNADAKMPKGEYSIDEMGLLITRL